GIALLEKLEGEQTAIRNDHAVAEDRRRNAICDARKLLHGKSNRSDGQPNKSHGPMNMMLEKEVARRDHPRAEESGREMEPWPPTPPEEGGRNRAPTQQKWPVNRIPQLGFPAAPKAHEYHRKGQRRIRLQKYAGEQSSDRPCQ